MVQVILTSLRVKLWIHEERGFERLEQAIPLLEERPQLAPAVHLAATGPGHTPPLLAPTAPPSPTPAWPCRLASAFIYQNFHGHVLCARLCV